MSTDPRWCSFATSSPKLALDVDECTDRSSLVDKRGKIQDLAKIEILMRKQKTTNSYFLYLRHMKGVHSRYDTFRLPYGIASSPYGESLVDEHQNSINTAYKYNAKERDRETGLYYYGARFYDPTVSLWLSVDPLADHPNQVDKSPYAYVWNNPVSLTDPDGRFPICPVLYAFAVGVGVDAGAGISGFISNFDDDADKDFFNANKWQGNYAGYSLGAGSVNINYSWGNEDNVQGQLYPYTQWPKDKASPPTWHTWTVGAAFSGEARAGASVYWGESYLHYKF